jgi:hypothetical protein
MRVHAVFFCAFTVVAACFHAQPVFAQTPPTATSPTARPSGLFPADYRARIAVILAREYAREASGPPQITAAVTSTGGLLSTDKTHGATSVCVQYPIRPTLLNLGRTSKAIQFVGHRDVMTFGKTAFTRTARGRGPATCLGATTRFTELEAAAQKLKACQNSGQNCVVSYRLGGNDVSVAPREAKPAAPSPPAVTR